MKGAARSLVAVLALASVAGAQPRPQRPPPAPSATPTNLRSRIGVEPIVRLLHGDAEERLRGIQRAAALATPEAVGLLAEAVERDRAAQLRAEPRSLLAMARALAPFADQERARSALATILGVGTPSFGGRPPAGGLDAAAIDPVAQLELARDIAAIALARGGGEKAVAALLASARGGGNGQTAALVGLTLHPPREPGPLGAATGALPVAVLKRLGDLGDLRVLDALHAAARSPDVAARSAALVALGELGDTRAIPLARTAIAEGDARLRGAAAEVFVLLAAPEREKAVAALLADEATTGLGLALAGRVPAAALTPLVAARAVAPDRELRAAALAALGRSPDPAAAKALADPRVLAEPESAYLALSALARSPAPNAGTLLVGLFGSRVATLAARAYVVRALVRGEHADDAAVFRLARAPAPVERAVGVFARVALGADDAEAHLGDPDVRIRRAAAMGALVRPRPELLRHLATEPDRATRTVLAAGLLEGDPEALVPTRLLVERATGGDGDAPLAAHALARRADASVAREVGQLLASSDPVLRTHAARGLASAPLADATGRLAAAFAVEADVDVRRAIVLALAVRTGEAAAPARREVLATAALFDPDAEVRSLAMRPPRTLPRLRQAEAATQVAWLRLTRVDGAPPGEPFTGAVVAADGIAVPVVFDDEGFAVVAGLPPGEARLVLAPRMPADQGRGP